jgi:intein/homing endonuclease
MRYESFAIPNPNDCNDFNGDPRKLKVDGDYVYAPVGTSVIKDDILIGVIVTGSPENPMFAKHKNKINTSIRYDHKLPGVVHSVQKGFDGKGYKYIRLVVAQERSPVLGDKFSATHGQKGTIGTIYPTNKMPLLKKSGITPDILINPLAFPSRMTIGMLLEMIMGVAITSSALSTDDFDKPICLNEPLEGCYESIDHKIWRYPEGFDPKKDYERLSGDASPWDTSFSINTYYDALKRIGLDQNSREIAINPETGEELQYPIFTAIVFYQRLKHMSVDKIHARARGNRHGFHKQPTEGRKKGGGFRFGHMERDKCHRKTPIALREGVSVRIEDLDKFEKVWGWNDIEKGLESSNQIGHHQYDDKSLVYTMTLQDGRRIHCGINHPFYMEADMKYADLKDIIPGEDRVVCTIARPLVNFSKDLKRCRGFEWDSDFFTTFHKNAKPISEYEVLRRSLCLARLVGLVITDGHANKSTNAVSVYVGHETDILTVQEDISRLTGCAVTYKFDSNGDNGSSYNISVPNKLALVIRDMGILKGNKVTQECFFPNFINEDTPLPILREFLGGLFGGDGHTFSLSKHREKHDLIKSVAFSWTRNEENLDALRSTLQLLSRLLDRFDIKSTIQNPKLTTTSKNSGKTKHYEMVLAIALSSAIRFSERIGFRYCEHKAIKLDIGVSYLRFRDNALRQRMIICERVDELVNYKTRKLANKLSRINTGKAIEQAEAELAEREPILHKLVIPDGKIVGRIIMNPETNTFRSSNFPCVDEYITEIGAIDMFLGAEDGKTNYGTKRGNPLLPYYFQRVLSIKSSGKMKQMYDIQVDDTESYVANGIVSHNCMLGQGTPFLVNDRLFHQSDAHQTTVCSVCGVTAVDNGTTVECRLCGNSECVLTDIPYGTKLMCDEFQVMNFVPRIITLPVNK